MDLEPVRIVVKHTFLNVENSIGSLSNRPCPPRRASDSQIRYHQPFVPDEVGGVQRQHSWSSNPVEVALGARAARPDAAAQNLLLQEREHRAEEQGGERDALSNRLCSLRLSDIRNSDGDGTRTGFSSEQGSRASSISDNRHSSLYRDADHYGSLTRECEHGEQEDERRKSVSSIMTDHSDLPIFCDSWSPHGTGSGEALLPQIPSMSMLTPPPQMQHASAGQQLPLSRQDGSLGARQHGNGASAVGLGVEQLGFSATACGANLSSLSTPPVRAGRPTVMPSTPPVVTRQSIFPRQNMQVAPQHPQPMYHPQQAQYHQQGAGPYFVSMGSQAATTPVATAAYMAPQLPRQEVDSGRSAGLGSCGSASPQRMRYSGQQMQQPPRAKAPPQVNLLTTLMMRNFPEGFSRNMLIRMLDDAGFTCMYDFVYMPVNFKTKMPFGYAFVNMVTPNVAQYCCEYFQGFKQWGVITDKVCEVSWSNTHQGLAAHLQRYRNSPVMHESVPDEYRPVVYAGGVRVAFPPPTKKLRVPRVRKSPASFADGSGDETDPSAHL